MNVGKGLVGEKGVRSNLNAFYTCLKMLKSKFNSLKKKKLNEVNKYPLSPALYKVLPSA